ncbi:hypothetical protein [Aquabacterium sp.]|uniref:hypothetical protein n=1 Tax=Aquabacterium sp. TaxID=1872578 RepID=UPI0025BDA705|nr:hypothetical protein [Aquabacterium sp.]
MFDALKRLIGPSTASGHEGETLAAWAKVDGLVFKRVKDKSAGGGYVVESSRGWRVEWGASQRVYIHGPELRFRCDTGIPSDVQCILLTKVLAQTLESDVFNRYTNAMQTQIDHTLPDEMRWLAMHPRVSLAVAPVLAKRFALFTNAEPLTQRWLGAEVVQWLEEAAQTWWTDALVLVLTVNRGMLTLRMSGRPLESSQLHLVGALFERVALRLKEVGHG